MVERLKSLSGDRVKSVPKPATGTDTVVVACKIPNGLLMRTFKMVKKRRLVANVAVDEEMAEEAGRFQVRGPVVPFGMVPNIQIVGGYALTVGVPRDQCELFFQQNSDAPYVVNELVFWEPDVDRATARAKSLKSTKTGLEPLDPNNIPAAFARGVPGVSGIRKADLSDSDMGLANS